jgi:light-harvesting protein B-800-850 alpha chain
MIYGKIWTVVKPTIGIPVYLGAVAIAAFAVHLALVLNTTWMKAYLNGGKKAEAAAAASVTPALPDTLVAKS